MKSTIVISRSLRNFRDSRASNETARLKSASRTRRRQCCGEVVVAVVVVGEGVDGEISAPSKPSSNFHIIRFVTLVPKTITTLETRATQRQILYTAASHLTMLSVFIYVYTLCVSVRARKRMFMYTRICRAVVNNRRVYYYYYYSCAFIVVRAVGIMQFVVGCMRVYRICSSDRTGTRAREICMYNTYREHSNVSTMGGRLMRGIAHCSITDSSVLAL